MLTLSEMKEIIARGESVMYSGMIISRENIQNLPTEAELALASNDAKVIEATEASLQNELAKIQAQLSLLGSTTEVTSEAVAPSVSASEAGVKKGKKTTE